MLPLYLLVRWNVFVNLCEQRAEICLCLHVQKRVQQKQTISYIKRSIRYSVTQ